MGRTFQFGYRGRDGAGRVATGFVEAVTIQEAIRMLNAKGVHVQAIGPDRIPPEHPPIEDPLTKPAHSLIEPLLMQVVHDNATRIEFTFGADGVRIVAHWGDVAMGMHPLPPERSKDVLACLARLAGEPKLGRERVRRPVNVNLGEPFDHFETVAAMMVFRSDRAGRDGTARVVITLPAAALDPPPAPPTCRIA